MFHDPALEDGDESIGKWLALLNKDLNEIFLTNARRAVENNGHKLIPFFVNTIVGSGLPQSAATRSGSPENNGQIEQVQTTFGGVSTPEAPFAYLVPASVSKLLGRVEPSKQGGIGSYADLLDLLVGVQSYPCRSIPSASYAGVVPDVDPGHPEARLGRWYTPTPEVLGAFWPTNVEFVNKPLWALLQQFLNPHINELYTCMRVNPAGSVLPTLVLRQQVLTTPTFEPGDLPVTRFLDLGRWKMPTSMVTDVDLGRSDVTRFNFCHVYGQDSYAGDNVALYKQIVINPPIRDDLDIQRSGLRPYMGMVACKLEDIAGKVPSSWIRLVADFNMGGHLQLNGTISSFGIQEPIAEGDNLEWDGCVFQIESCSHSCRVDTSSGRRSFRTTLALSHGMSANSQANNVSMYAGMPGIAESSLESLNPGTSYEGENHAEQVEPEQAVSTEGK